MSDMSWENPRPLGQGRAESLKMVMLAMMEGKDFSDDEKAAMREMWTKVLSVEKALADFGYLVDRVEPPAPILEQAKAESGILF